MRYTRREENDAYVAELTFNALSYEELHDKKLPRPSTRVRVQVRRREADFARIIELGDVSVPSAPWFDARLMVLMDDILFVGLANGLLLIDPADATVSKHIRTGNTEVVQIEPDFGRRRILVVNEAYGFSTEDGASNVAALDYDGTLAWRAPEVSEAWETAKGYSHIMAMDQTVLEVTTWSGRCHLDITNGHIISCWFTKGS